MRPLVAALALGIARCPAAAGAQPTISLFNRGNEIPELVREVKPAYTGRAMGRLIEGNVRMLVVVEADGTVGDVRILQSLDPTYGLDEAAVAAMRGWMFKPGTRLEAPARLSVIVEMGFSLRPGPPSR